MLNPTPGSFARFCRFQPSVTTPGCLASSGFCDFGVMHGISIPNYYGLRLHASALSSAATLHVPFGFFLSRSQ